MYKVIPWDYPNDVKVFDTYLSALQYGNINYGSRYDLIDLIENEEEN